MPLLALWASNPTAIGQFTVEQIVAAAGSGDLRDNSDCAQELREYLSQVTSQKLAEYIDRCLSAHFSKSGGVLQDLINELGRRLDYRVTNGRYQGTTNSIGFDGIWTSPEGQTLIVEVKTTDAYRISLDTITGYRDKLLKTGQIVGREDTGELEAQIRGSRYAWDMRLISADALIKLVQLKENAEGPETGQKIRSLLVPREYTRLDQMVDVMFTTAKDVERAIEAVDSEQEQAAEVDDAPEKVKGAWEFTDSKVLQAKRDEIIRALSSREGVPLIKRVGPFIGVQITVRGRPLRYQSTMHEGVVLTIGMHTIRNGMSFSRRESADIWSLDAWTVIMRPRSPPMYFAH